MNETVVTIMNKVVIYFYYMSYFIKCYNIFQEGDGDWGKADCLVCAVGVDEDVVYSKSTGKYIQSRIDL